MFGGGGAPSSQAVPPAPRTSDADVQRAAAEALRRRTRQRGYRATILSKDLVSEDTRKRLETLGS